MSAANPIKYVEGDLFGPTKELGDSRCVIIPHVVNDAGAWGAGFVVPLGRTYPISRAAYVAWSGGDKQPDGAAVYGADDQFAMRRTQIVKANDQQPGVWVANMCAQHRTGGVRPLNYAALGECMNQVMRFAVNAQRPEIHCPMFGSGLAGGNWDFIEKMIEDAWCFHGVPVTVYYIPGQTPPGWTPPKA